MCVCVSVNRKPTKNVRFEGAQHMDARIDALKMNYYYYYYMKIQIDIIAIWWATAAINNMILDVFFFLFIRKVFISRCRLNCWYHKNLAKRTHKHVRKIELREAFRHDVTECLDRFIPLHRIRFELWKLFHGAHKRKMRL